MILAKQPQDELRDLLRSLADGSAAADGVRRIDELARRDQRLLREYIEYMRLVSDLRFGPTNQRVEETLDLLFSADSADASGQWPDASGRWPVASGQGVESRESRVESESISGQWPVVSGQYEMGCPEIPKSRNPEIPHLQISKSPNLQIHTLNSWAFSYAVATLLVGIALLGAWFHSITHPDADTLLANSRGSISSGSVDKEKSQLVFVGRVSGMVDCQWADPTTETVAGAGVALNRRYALKSGLMELTYSSGAKVILQGPCDYTVESPNSGFLQVGKLVAKVESQVSRVERKAESGKRKAEYSRLSTLNSRLFAVRTPTALVEDLGTEFGVEVLESGETASHVFEGKVVVKIEGAGDGGRGTGDEISKSQIPNPKSQIFLSAGQSARVEKDNKSGELKLLSGDKIAAAEIEQTNFVRRLREPPKLLDLLDIVAGGNGLGMRRERGIDPATAMEAPLFLPRVKSCDHEFRPVVWHDLIDGVFVPDGGDGPVQLNSAGHSCAEFPATTRKAFGSIWARAADIQPDNRTSEVFYWVYAMDRGDQFQPENRGLLGICPNAGITFDLEAMRRRHKGVVPVRFRATAGMADAGPLYPAADGMADLRVFIDGQLKLKRVGLHPQDGTLKVDIALGPTDRFLTLAVTDGGNGLGADWVVFGDPVILVQPIPDKQPHQP